MKTTTKLSMATCVMALKNIIGYGRKVDSDITVMDTFKWISKNAKPKGRRISTASHPNYEMQRKQKEVNDKHSMRCQFRIKGNTITADGKHQFYMKNGVVTNRESL